MNNVYPFVDSPRELSALANSPIYKIMAKLNAGGRLNTGTDDGFDGFKHKNEKGEYCTRKGYSRAENDYVCFNEIEHQDAYRHGIYKLMGWIFDFRPFFKKWLVKYEYSGWQEQYAPDRDFIFTNSSTPDEILKVMPFPEDEECFAI
ncbi:MAG: hypothetical protein LBC86_07345 [Oscillospiraceae bacterium]|jgi:hypothetical protein|nr:hypothetical protein [Oscillospiraceae bacterium]